MTNTLVGRRVACIQHHASPDVADTVHHGEVVAFHASSGTAYVVVLWDSGKLTSVEVSRVTVEAKPEEPFR